MTDFNPDGPFIRKLLGRMSAVEMQSKKLFDIVSRQKEDISDLDDRCSDMSDSIDELSDLVTGKMDFYSGSLDERNSYRRMRDSEYSTFKYVIGNTAVYEDEDYSVRAEAYDGSDERIEMRMQALEDMLLEDRKATQMRFEQYEKKLDDCLEGFSELKMEMELMLHMFAATFNVNIVSD